MFIISNVIGGNTLFNSTQEFLTDVLHCFVLLFLFLRYQWKYDNGTVVDFMNSGYV